MEPNDQNRPGENGGEWKKEQPGGGRPFDFDAFLGPESLEDQVTDALDGKDLLDEEAYGSYPPGYIPRRGGAGDRGRHEAPEPEPEPEFPGDPPTQRFTVEDAPETLEPPPAREEPPARPNLNRSEPPPRPKVVVAQPTPRVVITPEQNYSEPKPEKKGMGKALKFLIALLLTAAVVLAVAAVAAIFLPGIGGEKEPAPSPTDYLFGGLPTRAPMAPTVPVVPTAPPVTPEPAPTPPPAVYHAITVTAGSGGSVSPSGIVDVQEGESVTFSIMPEAGYNLGQLLIDGASVPVTSAYTFSDVRQDHTLYAVFQALPEATEPPPVVTDPPPATDVPVVPDVPVIPDIPVVSDTPVTPEEPAVPDVPPAAEG